MTDVQIVPGRSCANCTMCCKLFDVVALSKPRLQWCNHCDPAKGCKIYDQRPETCRDFYCSYLLNPALDDTWKPSKSKLVLTFEPAGNRVTVHVDPARPDAWQQEPYYSKIKQWANRAAGERGQVLVWVGKRTIAILPHTDKDLGEVLSDQYIVSTEKRTASGMVIDVVVVDYDDPIAARVRAQAAIAAS